MVKRRRLRVWLLVGTAVVVSNASALYLLNTIVFGAAPAWMSTTKACTQPPNIDYGGGATYGVYVWKPTVVLSLHKPRSVALVSREGAYGNAIELHAATDARQVTCQWDADGVEIREPDGVVHAVPATVFKGGR
jgi:hypothetical protein